MTFRLKLAGVLLGLIGAVGFSYAHPFGDPHAEAAQDREALLRDAHMPENARRVLVNKCADCHSDTTRWPVYTRLAPGSWLMERDVVKGRKHLNLSHWLEESQERRDLLSQEIVQQARIGAMPLPQYKLLHWRSGLSAADVAALSLLSPDVLDADTELGGDAARGGSVFRRRCTGCHATDADREGPRLRGVFGSRAGAKTGFRYSDALKHSGIEWTDVNLERWLRDADMVVPGNAMDFSVPKVQERADIIAYLRTLQ